MIDLHCHIIFGTDDGAKELENSINILREAYEAGFTKICCTPHYIVPQYVKTKSENLEKLNIIKEKLKEENIDIELYLGNEIYVTNNMKELIEEAGLEFVTAYDAFTREPVKAESERVYVIAREHQKEENGT